MATSTQTSAAADDVNIAAIEKAATSLHKRWVIGFFDMSVEDQLKELARPKTLSVLEMDANKARTHLAAVEHKDPSVMERIKPKLVQTIMFISTIRDMHLLRQNLEAIRHQANTGEEDGLWAVPTTLYKTENTSGFSSVYSAAAVMDENKMDTDAQKLYVRLLQTAAIKRLRRLEDKLYQRLTTESGHDTHAYGYYMHTRDFVASNAHLVDQLDNFKLLTKKESTFRYVSDTLLTCLHQPHLPDLVRNRHVFAFENGIYVTCKNVVLGDPEGGEEFYPYDDTSKTLPEDVVAAKYFKGLVFDDSPVQDWYHDIKTPALQRIMTHQDWPEEVCRIMYVLIGRLLYNVNEKDSFQVTPFLYGRAGTGKSTVVEYCAGAIYDDEDIGALSSNIEKQFGISAFVKKMIILAPEVKAGFQMDLSEFQSMVSGERVQVAKKHKTAETISHWMLPMIMAGNEIPAWFDNAGQLLRRIIIFRYNVSVNAVDGSLKTQIASQMADVIRKCNLAYLEFVSRNNGDIWKQLPKYFHKEKSALAKRLNPLDGFLNDATCVSQDPTGVDYNPSLERRGMRLDPKWTGQHNGKTYDENEPVAMVLGCKLVSTV